jgi:hypothetical protein
MSIMKSCQEYLDKPVSPDKYIHCAFLVRNLIAQGKDRDEAIEKIATRARLEIKKLGKYVGEKQ